VSFSTATPLKQLLWHHRERTAGQENVQNNRPPSYHCIVLCPCAVQSVQTLMLGLCLRRGVFDGN
jgi:hypothetical protein